MALQLVGPYSYKAESAIAKGATVTLGTAAQTVKACGTTDTPLGTAMDAATEAGRQLRVQSEGVAECKAAGAFSKGDLLVVSNANGDVDTVAALTVGDTAYLIGVALQGASGAGSLVPVKLGLGIAWPQGDLVKVFTAGTGGATAGCAMKQDSTAGQAVLAAAATDRPIGIALATVLEAATVAVQIAGICDCKADAAYALGDTLMVADANGELDTLAGNGALYSVGTAMTTASGAGTETNGILIGIQLHNRGVVDVELLAHADLTTHQYAAVAMHTDENEVAICGVEGRAIGILQNAPDVGEVAIVRVAGPSSCIADADYVIGDALSCVDATNGELDTAAGGSEQCVGIVGYALKTAAAQGVITDGILVQPHAFWFGS